MANTRGRLLLFSVAMVTLSFAPQETEGKLCVKQRMKPTMKQRSSFINTKTTNRHWRAITCNLPVPKGFYRLAPLGFQSYRENSI